jgi:hypothetical protein
MLRACIDLALAALILWFSISGIRSGVKRGLFPGFLIATRAPREQKPFTFWANILFRLALIVVALVYLLVVLWAVMHGRPAP